MLINEQQHIERIKEMLFRSGSRQLPDWLLDASHELLSHYSGIGTLGPFLRSMNKWQESAEYPFEIFVIGEGNFGKSTLLNALLAAQLSPVSFLPETRAFLRFIPRETPSSSAKLYVRTDPAMHGWLLDRIGLGQTSPLDGTREHQLPLQVADELLAEDARRCRESDGSYLPAIVECEKEVHTSERTILPTNVRIVDTQGLNQIFPDELASMNSGINQGSTRERFVHWLRSTARGTHLQWQFRRCDAVICVAHARKSSSVVTRTALEYFSKYGKPTLLVVTNVDRVASSEGGLEEAMRVTEEAFGPLVSETFPLNGKLALESVLSQDALGLDESGLSQLADAIRAHSTVRASMHRAVGRYDSAVVTEQQMRRSMRFLRRAIETLVEVTDKMRALLVQTAENLQKELRKGIGEAAAHGVDAVRPRVANVTCWDNGAKAADKINVALARKRLESTVSQQLRESRDKLSELVSRFSLHPLRIPEFDADGNARWHSYRVGRPKLEERCTVQSFSIMFELSEDILGGMSIGVSDFMGLFFAGSREAAAHKRKRIEGARHRALMEQFEGPWQEFVAGVEADALRVLRTYVDSCDRLISEAISASLALEGGDPAAACEEIDRRLARFSMQPAFLNAVSNGLASAQPKIAVMLDRAVTLAMAQTSSESMEGVRRNQAGCQG